MSISEKVAPPDLIKHTYYTLLRDPRKLAGCSAEGT